ncbi:uncharacterized protein FOMMEDRAFT_105314 [Fomitiporia mediterranea MF3/22]|uniref:uncharacterized protein n=1 Tax=Fomitiporia mediterranea (strain MF3/22) TaxID=694068 RepID=UPI000440925C|nr:uncharacterized protein FOMMEDRAFT_105314 [Fomitiporia mediterranea MF3/22]EJD05073.1 hypothetical protein FOMMEDRAFT_105314 [Fomitiporia mediterranea MF3/22]
MQAYKRWKTPPAPLLNANVADAGSIRRRRVDWLRVLKEVTTPNSFTVRLPRMRPHDTLSDSLSIRSRWYARRAVGLVYDLRSDPRHTYIATYNGDMADLCEPATRHPSRYMRIIIRPIPGIELSVDVTSGAYVTVGQVLWAVYCKLRQPIAQYEWWALSKDERRDVAAAFYRRLEASSRPQYDYYNGVRGVDLFCGDTTFRGLEPSYKGSDVWELVIRKNA